MNQIFRKIRSKLERNPRFLRKLKILFIVGFAALFMTFGLVVWAGVSLFNYASSRANQAVESPEIRQGYDSLKKQALNFKKNKGVYCWEKAQTLLAVKPWLEHSAIDNLEELKVACVEEKKTDCKGSECDWNETSNNS